MHGEQNDERYTQQLAERLRAELRPRCPQLRVSHTERLYPVEGYCVLANSPGHFMIPSIVDAPLGNEGLRIGVSLMEKTKIASRSSRGRERATRLRIDAVEEDGGHTTQGRRPAMPRPKAVQRAQTSKTPVARRKRKSPTSHAASTAGSAPSRETIAARAYALFLARGAQHGNDWADWIQAETELRGSGRSPGGEEPGGDDALSIEDKPLRRARKPSRQTLE